MSSSTGRGRGLAVLGATALIFGLAAPPTSATVGAAVATAQPAVSVSAAASPPGGRVIVGDSLAVSVSSALRSRNFTVRAKVGRQFSVAPRVVSGFGASLPRNVVIELGTNGTISLADCRTVVRTAGKGRRVFLVTNRVPRSWEKPNRQTIRDCNRSYAGPRVRVINWYRHSAGHPKWFASDGFHLSAKGRTSFVRLIDGFVDDHRKR